MTIEATGYNSPLPEDLEALVEEQIRTIKVAGRTYDFRPETKCRVCRSDDLRQRIEDMLACGATYAEIIRLIAPDNTRRARADQITYHSVRKHATECFNLAKPAALVYRGILERRAQQREVDFVKGTGHAVTIMALLEAAMVKGYAAITDDRIPITPELAISSGLKLHQMMNAESGAMQHAEMVAQVNRITQAVNRICSPEQIREIEAALSPGEDGAIDVDYTTDDDMDWQDDEEFDPTRDTDERIVEGEDGF